MAEAPPRERAALARSAILMNMVGQKKTAKFSFLRKGEQISVSIILNTLTKFSKLAVGKHVVSAKRQHSSDESLFPLTVSISGLSPLTKVWVDYEPQPRNTFLIKVNDVDIYSLVKEEIDYDPTITEALKVYNIKVNEKEIINRSTPWIINDVEEKIQNALGMGHLESLEINSLDSKSWIANELLDALTCYDLPE